MIIYLVCYDITDDKIRNAVARELEAYGDRVQRSVFEISVRTDAELSHLIECLRDIAKEELDIRLYRLCQTCRQASMALDNDDIALFPSTIIV